MAHTAHFSVDFDFGGGSPTGALSVREPDGEIVDEFILDRDLVLRLLVELMDIAEESLGVPGSMRLDSCAA
jgi:hypothetical protein